MTHKSIFVKLSEFKGNPISEYLKISKFAKTRVCSFNGLSFYQIFNSKFELCKLLRSHYCDFYDCVSKYENALEPYKDCLYEKLPDDIKLELLDLFLNYCEILLCMFYVTIDSYPDLNQLNYYLEKDTFIQFLEIISTSLKSMNFKIEIVNEEIGDVKIIKDNPEAECVAKQSPKNIREAIIDYLGSRDSDSKEKEKSLHHLIDMLELTLEKYENADIVNKVKEYVQLVRHPEKKKEQKEYAWYFKDKTSYFDLIFSMCIFVQEYSLTKDSIEKFGSLKKEAIAEQ